MTMMAEMEFHYDDVLGCCVRMEDRTCSRYEDISQRDKILAELNSQHHAREFLDLVVKVQDMEFPCHRAVLASTPYFKVMFSSDFTERRSKVVQLYGIDSDGFSKILDFLYTGEIYITQDDVHDILQAAHMLQIDKITEYCQTFIEERYDLSNCLSAMPRLSDLYGFSGLREQARKDTLSNFSWISQSEEFLTLSGEELLDLLTDKKLHVTDEENIVDAVIRWLDHDPENCRTAIVSIFQEIHLMSVRVSTLKKLEMHPVIQDSPECLAIVAAAKEKHLACVSAGAELDEAKVRQRLGTSDDLAFLVGGCMIGEGSMCDAAWTTPLQSVMCLDPNTEQYYHVTALPMHITGYMSVTSAERCLYVTGLYMYDPDSVPLRQAFRYDFVANAWTQLPHMPRGRAGHQSVVVDGKLFLVGGDADDTSTFSMDCYDLKEEAWIKPQTLPEIASLDLTVKSCNGKIVLVELFDDTENACSWLEETKLRVHVFDVRAAHWSYSDIPVLYSRLQSVCKLVTVVHGNVHILLNLRDSYSPQMFLYDVDVELGTLSELEDTGPLSVSFWGTQYQEEHTIHQGDLANAIICYKFNEDNDSISGSREADITRTWDLTFELIGHSFLAISNGWYCRDLYKLEH